MPKTFTDYLYGFNNLVYLHYESKTINKKERDTLLRYLQEVQDVGPLKTFGNTKYWDDLLKEDDTSLTPKYCSAKA